MNPATSQPEFTITIEPYGRRVSVPEGTTLLEAARQARLEVNAVCGGRGTCGACKAQLIAGSFSDPTPQEENLLGAAALNSQFRLACLTSPRSDAVVHFPPESLGALQRLQLEGGQNAVPPHPAVRRLEVDLSSPDPSRKQSDPARVREALKVNGYLHTDLSEELQQKIIGILQTTGGKVSLVLDGQRLVTALSPEDHLLGLAVDLGTTKLAAYLMDLESGATLASGGILNPQIAYGEDVISRIQYADEHPDGAKTLQQVLVEGLNDLTATLASQLQAPPEEITDCVIVGNTAMHHLLAGLPAHTLGTAPYLPASVEAMRLDAHSIGLKLAPDAGLYLPPNIAGFVGGDHVAMLLATRVRHSRKTVLALDIGTNTEISLFHKGRHLSCSCASGPAFEGAHIRHGLRAIPGAIEHVFIEGDRINVQTVADRPAVGICGSGILDAAAEMRRAGMINSRGAFNKDDPRITQKEGRAEFVLVPAGQFGAGVDITLDRQDIQQVQLAKAAIRSGVEILLREASIGADDIDLLLVAGAFGTYLDMANCQRIGMFPQVPLERVHQVGNAAGAGAREMLVSTLKREEAEAMLDKIEYVELTTVKDYVDFFTDAISL